MPAKPLSMGSHPFACIPSQAVCIHSLTSNAEALSLVDRGLVDVFSNFMPERARVVFMSDAPKLLFARQSCPSLHVPYLDQVWTDAI